MREQNYCFLIIIGSGKQNYTVLFCGNAAALALPPYVIYKSANLYDEWCNGGPSGIATMRQLQDRWSVIFLWTGQPLYSWNQAYQWSKSFDFRWSC